MKGLFPEEYVDRMARRGERFAFRPEIAFSPDTRYLIKHTVYVRNEQFSSIPCETVAAAHAVTAGCNYG